MNLISSTFTLKCIKLYGYSKVMHLIIFSFCIVTRYNVVAILGEGFLLLTAFYVFTGETRPWSLQLCPFDSEN